MWLTQTSAIQHDLNTCTSTLFILILHSGLILRSYTLDFKRSPHKFDQKPFFLIGSRIFYRSLEATQFIIWLNQAETQREWPSYGHIKTWVQNKPVWIRERLLKARSRLFSSKIQSKCQFIPKIMLLMTKTANQANENCKNDVILTNSHERLLNTSLFITE